MKQCQAVTTLRSGRAFQNVETPAEVEKHNENVIVEEEAVEDEPQIVREEGEASSSKKSHIKGAGHYFSTRAISTTPSSHQQRTATKRKSGRFFNGAKLIFHC